MALRSFAIVYTNYMSHDESLEAKVSRIDERTEAILGRLDKLVTHDEFQPVKRIVYGLVAFALLSYASLLAGMIIKG